MGTSDTALGWITTYGFDCQQGDLIRINGVQHRIAERERTDFTRTHFVITTESGERHSVGKLSQIDIYDPDGSVTERITKFNEGAP